MKGSCGFSELCAHVWLDNDNYHLITYSRTERNYTHSCLHTVCVSVSVRVFIQRVQACMCALRSKGSGWRSLQCGSVCDDMMTSTSAPLCHL